MKMDRSRLCTVFRINVGIRESSAFFGILVLLLKAQGCSERFLEKKIWDRRSAFGSEAEFLSGISLLATHASSSDIRIENCCATNPDMVYNSYDNTDCRVNC